MSKFRQGSHKLKDGQKIYFGDNNKGSAYYDSGTSTLVIATTSGNINLSPGGSGNVILDNQSFPNTAGEVGEGLTTDGAGTLSWAEGEAGEPTPGDRGCYMGGHTGAVRVNTIDYITISSTGDATNFGDLTQEVNNQGGTGSSNGANDRGTRAGGQTDAATANNTIDYITISTTGNATNFGDLTYSERYNTGCSNGTNDRAINWGGHQGSDNWIYYYTISTTGNADDFGLATGDKSTAGATSNGINNRGVLGGGAGPVNTIDYITITTLGNAVDFGDLTVGRTQTSAGSNGTNNIGVFLGGHDGDETDTIDYITINSAGNATDFGNLTIAAAIGGTVSNKVNDRLCHALGKDVDANVVNSIDYVTISSTGNSSNFGDLTVSRRNNPSGVSNA